MISAQAQAVATTVMDYLDHGGHEWEAGSRDGEFVVTLPGERKLRTVVSLLAGARAVTISAFVIRAPDGNHEAFYAHLLRRNLRLPGIAYGIDRSGDVFVAGRIPAAAVTADLLDDTLGAVLAACDDPFNELLALGFLDSMRKEWAWRVDRGESLANLEAFRDLLERPGDPGPPN